MNLPIQVHDCKVDAPDLVSVNAHKYFLFSN